MKPNVKGYIKKLKDSYWYAKSKYIKYFDQLPIQENAILLEASHGKELSGNIFYILKYLAGSKRYSDYDIFVSAFGRKNAEIYRMFLDERGYQNVTVLIVASDDYYKAAASAKYLINDTSFSPFFIKKEGQVYINTWHGTPLKNMGKKVANDAVNTGNVQKNFVAADYLIFPNPYTKEHMLDDYMLENISPQTKTVLCAYPRNEIFFDEGQRKELRRELGLDHKRFYAYMPTFRGQAYKPNVPKNDAYLLYYLYELDKMLNEDEVLFVNLHPLSKKNIDFEDFIHIQSFPEEFETYEILNAADILITDYSSVFFDFACTRKKIVLFPYDKEDYFRERGTYILLNELPFPQVYSLDELVTEIRNEKCYDDTAFLQKFCPYDNKQAAKQLCDFAILQEKNGLYAEPIPDNGKENVFIYAGNLAKNGITTSLKSLLTNIDVEKRNYYVTFNQSVTQENGAQLKELPPGANYFAIAGWFNLSPLQKVIRVLFDQKMFPANLFAKFLKKRLEQNLIRSYGGARIDTLVEFNGYDDDVIMMFSVFKGKKCIYVHNDLIQEAKTRGYSRKDVLRYAYQAYDRVLPVSEDIIPPMKSLLKHNSHVQLCKNVIDFETVRMRAALPVTLEKESRCSVPYPQLLEKLSSTAPKFINIARFSPEKGHDRLVEAFYKIHQKRPDALLFIMGGNSYGDHYEKLFEKLQTMKLTNSVVLLLNIANPYAILNACDFFVLSSFYEGFGLVLAEADILGKPVISTDIAGPRGFMLQHGGTLIKNSEQGIYEGMSLLLEGKVTPMNVDYKKYNRECIQEFEAAISFSK